MTELFFTLFIIAFCVIIRNHCDILDEHTLDGYITRERSTPVGGHFGNLVDNVHAFDDLAEHSVAPSLGRGGGKIEKSLLTRLMKNWEVADSGSEVRAMAIVPRSFFRPLLASFLIGGKVVFFI